MPGFDYQDSRLVCDGVPLGDIARAVGTPVYVYSAAAIAQRVRAFDAAFAPHPHALHYALKANSTLAIVRLLRALGCGADANSGGEIGVALRAGVDPGAIVFTGVGKTDEELAHAVTLGLKAINVESAGELARIDRLARTRGVVARVAVRVNPDIDARSHPHITTGLRTSKFGVPVDVALRACRAAAEMPGLRLVALHVHLGSQILCLEPLARAVAVLVELAGALREDGIALEYLDLGGGLGISYDGTPAPTPAEYAAALLPALRDRGLPVVLEPGRAILGPAGALLARVIDVKEQGRDRLVVVLDAGMTELLRPALYGAYHRIQPVEPRDRPDRICDVVGPVCESSDTVGTDRRLPAPEPGDLVAILDAGAYGAVMASNYNRRPMPPEVLVEGGRFRTVRRRQTLDDLLALES